MTTDRGHHAVPHTADVRIEAWAPTQEECLAEAVAALVECFADVKDASAGRTVTAELAADTDEDRLIAVLDQVIYLVDTEDAVAVGLTVEIDAPVLRVAVPVVDLADVEIIGSAPKAVALSELRMEHAEGRWNASAIVDV